MGVKYILSQAGKKMGLDPSDTLQRSVLLRFLNEAADELYTQSDMAGSLMEQAFKVNGDQTIALPWYVGEVRAAREYNSQIPWSINQLRPRYNQMNWKDYWRNYRLKGKMPLMSSVKNQSVGVLTVHAVENPPVVVTVTGPTENSSSINESVTMDAVSKSTVNQFLDYTAVVKDRVNTYDVTLSDVDGSLLTVIPNNRLDAVYQIIDVSTAPWLGMNISRKDHYMEFLYKKALTRLENDGDEFPAPGYDNILVNKMMQLWAEEQGKADEALAYDAKATRSLARKTEEQNRATEDTIALVENPHDALNSRLRPRRPGRYGGYSTGQRYGGL